MNIFFASEHRYRIQWNSRLWYYNHYLPLVDLNHNLIVFNYNVTPHYQNADPTNPRHLSFIERNREKLETELLRQVKEAHRRSGIDVFFSYFWTAICRPEVISEIKSLGILTVNWFCNAAHQFYLIRDLAPAFDYSLVSEKFRIEDYKKIGANPVYFPAAANPNVCKPYSFPKKYDVTFVGKRYGERYDMIVFLHQNSIPIHVWGDGWKHTSYLAKAVHYFPIGFVKAAFQARHNFPMKLRSSHDKIQNRFIHSCISDEQYIKMFSRSKISLGFSACGEAKAAQQRILQVRLRDIEAPMSGAFYITEYMPDLEDYYIIGKEIVCYYNRQELPQKIRYYLNHDIERQNITLAGYKRALKDHTCQKRFRDFFLKIKAVL